MSGLVAIANNTDGARICADRTKSLDAISNREHIFALINGGVIHATSETTGFRVGELLLTNGESYTDYWAM